MERLRVYHLPFHRANCEDNFLVINLNFWFYKIIRAFQINHFFFGCCEPRASYLVRKCRFSWKSSPLKDHLHGLQHSYMTEDTKRQAQYRPALTLLPNMSLCWDPLIGNIYIRYRCYFSIQILPEEGLRTTVLFIKWVQCAGFIGSFNGDFLVQKDDFFKLHDN